MSRKLALIDDGMAAVRSLSRQGRRSDALAQARRLLARPDLTLAAAADAHRVAAEILLDQDRHGAARRHLRAALSLEPEHARTNYLMGLAHERDPHGDDERAAKRYRRASRLVPSNDLYRAAYGRAAVRSGNTRGGARTLLAIGDGSLRDAKILEIAIEGLLEAGRVRAAERIIVRARFLCPGSGEVRRLGERVRFEAARKGQKRRSSTQDAGSIKEDATQLLPFVRVVRSSPGGMMPLAYGRRDMLSRPRPHLGHADG